MFGVQAVIETIEGQSMSNHTEPVEVETRTREPDSMEKIPQLEERYEWAEPRVNHFHQPPTGFEQYSNSIMTRWLVAVENDHDAQERLHEELQEYQKCRHDLNQRLDHDNVPDHKKVTNQL